MDFGFHQSLHRAIMMHSTGQDQIRRSLQNDIDGLTKALSGLDSRLDKQRFVENNNAAFMIPKKFEFNSVSRNEVLKTVLRLNQLHSSFFTNTSLKF
jgi:SLIT-ROBO Rho GTPase activating protein